MRLRSLEDQLERLRHVFERYHELEIDQVKRSSFQWVKAKLADHEEALRQLDALWRTKNLESMAELHTSLVLRFEKQRMTDELTKSSLSTTLQSKKDQCVQMDEGRIKAIYQKEGDVVEAQMSLETSSVPTIDLLESNIDGEGSRVNLSQRGIDEVQEEDLIEPVCVSNVLAGTSPSPSPVMSPEEGKGVLRLRFETELPNDALEECEYDELENSDGNITVRKMPIKSKTPVDGLSESVNLGSFNSTANKPKPGVECGVGTSVRFQEDVIQPVDDISTIENPQHQMAAVEHLQDEITRLRGIIETLCANKCKLTNEIVALKSDGDGAYPNKMVSENNDTQSLSPNRQKVILATPFASSNSQDNNDKDLSGQVALVKADMNQQYQNLLNEFTVEHAREVDRLKAGSFWVFFLSYHFVLMLEFSR